LIVAVGRQILAALVTPDFSMPVSSRKRIVHHADVLPGAALARF